MSGQEIHDRIVANNQVIEQEMQPITFVLNKKVAAALAENAQLRRNCTHEYVNHVCKWCLAEEKTK